MGITVTNGKTSGFHGANKIYIGRNNPKYRLYGGNQLANPYKIGKDGTREECIAKYKEWLWQCIKAENQIILKTLEMIKQRAETEDIELVCWCKPLACHGDILKSCLEWMMTQ
ncbi:DUF4326 domain-containing protein [Roseofilum sp. Belize Diploria]|uniref:DUF4326 domain-containing protein n=1 Tax=Roseofilum sp. Belize Diploria TaxID=2821501 RepID=UPI001B19C9D8|nr:DUF4326 domain-containing protein [Roseofilum sp. Belize Diploria]MBP0008066.1 DUF4326 domain-containing protein [Roseofilum sp. Belize Diploria]